MFSRPRMWVGCYFIVKEPGVTEESVSFPPAGVFREAVRDGRWGWEPPVRIGQLRRTVYALSWRRSGVLERFLRPCPATGAGVGAEPALAADGEGVVVGVMLAEGLFGLFLELCDGGQEEAALIGAGGCPCGPVEEFDHRLPQIVLLFCHGDGEICYLFVCRLANAIGPLATFHEVGEDEWQARGALVTNQE